MERSRRLPRPRFRVTPQTSTSITPRIRHAWSSARATRKETSRLARRAVVLTRIAQSVVATGSFSFTATLREDVAAELVHVERGAAEDQHHPVGFGQTLRQLFTCHLHA